MNAEQRYFTLVEVLIALAVLSLGILAETGLLSSARERCRKAEAEWQEQHAMTQAAEYFLLAGTLFPVLGLSHFRPPCQSRQSSRRGAGSEIRLAAGYDAPSAFRPKQ